MADAEYQPLTGDPDLIETKAAHYAQIAAAIDRSVRFLNAVRDMDGMTSKAVSAVSGKAGDVSDDIAKAFDRYNDTAQALTGYSGLLREAQADATAAITDIEQKQSAADAASRAATTAQQNLQDATDDTKDDAQTAATKAATAASDASAALQVAQAAWHAAWSKKNDAGNAAKDKITAVVTGPKNHGLKDPGGWGHILGDFFKAAFEVFRKICDIAGILAIFFSWVPILGEVLMVLAAVGAIIDLVTTIVNGGSFWDILLASANVVLTLVGGKLISELAKGVKIASTAKVTERLLSETSDVKRISTEVNRISGIAGRHAEGAVNFGSRQDAIKYLIKTRESVPGFGQMTANAFKKSFDPSFGGKTMKQVFIDSMKNNFTPKGLVSDDFNKMMRVAFTNSTGVGLKLSAQTLGVVGLQVGKDTVDVVRQYEKGDDEWGHGLPGLGKGYGKLLGIGSTVQATGGAFSDLGHAGAKVGAKLHYEAATLSH
ncbi:hypothetical protein GCM10022286_17230 [Gryllotalpicola daejeonensis]|uniref:WXG100 family type VII secretion target n=1 Tax=Gryllotalpicola daejeonensis TaxID=993087 RepID=A0ABP7ZJV4_9MICO